MRVEHEGFFADPEIGGEALRLAGIAGGRHRQQRQLRRRRRSWRRSRGSTGSASRIPAPARISPPRARRSIVERSGVRIGFLQRSSVYWPTNHEASARRGRHRGDPRPHRLSGAGVTRRGPRSRRSTGPACRPIIVTWADRAYLRAFATTSRRCARSVDIVVASCHWGLRQGSAGLHDRDRACRDRRRRRHRGRPRAALLAAGRGLKGKPIFYGLGSFSFHTGHGGRRHGDWIGMMARVDVGRNGSRRRASASCGTTRPTRPTGPTRNKEADELADLAERSAAYGAKLMRNGDEVRIGPA